MPLGDNNLWRCVLVNTYIESSSENKKKKEKKSENYTDCGERVDERENNGSVVIGNDDCVINCLTVIGEIEGHTESPRTQGYCYHLSKFHIYALVYYIGVFLSGLLHSIIGSSFIHLIRADSNVFFLMAE